jgi:predicted O-linked N-acetylglucosamine transferase (SPINDLY family)
MTDLFQIPRQDLAHTMACATRFHQAPGDDAARVAWASALLSRGHYGHAAAVLAGHSGSGISGAVDWARAHLLLADGSCTAALAAVADAERQHQLSPDQSVVAALIEIGAGDPAAALVRLAALGDADPRCAALFDDAHRWFDDPDRKAADILQQPMDSPAVELLASRFGMLQAWAAGDADRLHRVLMQMDACNLRRWSARVHAVWLQAVDADASPETKRVAAINTIISLTALQNYSSAAEIILGEFNQSVTAPTAKLCSYARFLMPFAPSVTGRQLRDIQRQALHGMLAGERPTPVQHARPAPLARRLRVGFLTPWYAEPYFLVAARYRDAARIELIAFVTNWATPPEGPGADREAGCYDAVSFVKEFDDRQIAQIIKDQEIDVLLDLTGQGSGQRGTVLEWRPAPIQVVWTTKLSTTGSSAIDWFLGDAALIPPEHDDHFCERVWRYPQIVTPCQSTHVEVRPSPAPRLDAGFITFGSPASLFKVSDAALATWSEILARVDRSRFVFIAPCDLTDEILCLYDRCIAAGFDPDRLVILYSIEPGDMLRMLSHVDIALDPFPFGCNRTAAECLAQGVPLLTLWGDRLTGRYTATQLQALGLDELIADNRADYIERAVALAHDGERLDYWRQALPERVRTSPIVDPERAMRTLETALFGMWDDYVARCGGEG